MKLSMFEQIMSVIGSVMDVQMPFGFMLLSIAAYKVAEIKLKKK